MPGTKINTHWKDGNGTTVDADLLISTTEYPHSERTSSLTFSSYVATADNSDGWYTDPLVYPGRPSPHLHSYLGNRLQADADLLNLTDEPKSWEAGSQADGKGFGFPGLTTHKGVEFGYAPGVWWPTIFWEGKRCTMVNGIATYYVRQNNLYPSGDDEYLTALPNGLGYVTFNCRLVNANPSRPAGNWRISVRGADAFHPTNAHIGAFPVANPRYQENIGGVHFGANKPAGMVWTPQFQTYLKFRFPNSSTSWQSNPPKNINDSRFTFGTKVKSESVPFHVDYVAAYGAARYASEIPNEGEFLQDMLDNCVNVRSFPSPPAQSQKWEGTRFTSDDPEGDGEIDVVDPPGEPDLEVIANFTWDNSGLTVNFDASLSSSLAGTITSYSWDFGDASGGSGEQVSHTYADIGEYTVTLTVNDDNADSDVIEVDIELEGFGQFPAGTGLGFNLGAAPAMFLAAITAPDGQRTAAG